MRHVGGAIALTMLLVAAASAQPHATSTVPCHSGRLVSDTLSARLGIDSSLSFMMGPTQFYEGTLWSFPGGSFPYDLSRITHLAAPSELRTLYPSRPLSFCRSTVYQSIGMGFSSHVRRSLTLPDYIRFMDMNAGITTAGVPDRRWHMKCPW